MDNIEKALKRRLSFLRERLEESRKNVEKLLERIDEVNYLFDRIKEVRESEEK